MKRYKFYFKLDSSKEPVGVVTAMSTKDATSYFASGKQMDVDAFSKIFIVEQYE